MQTIACPCTAIAAAASAALRAAAAAVLATLAAAPFESEFFGCRTEGSIHALYFIQCSPASISSSQPQAAACTSRRLAASQSSGRALNTSCSGSSSCSSV